MQRILRSTMLYSTLSSYASEQNKVLLNVCPPHLFNVFAVSRCGADGLLEWWSPLGGQAIALKDLTADQKTQLLKVLEHRKKSLAELADHLERQGQQDAADTIRWMLKDTDFRKLYSVDNQPVVIDWQRMELPTAVPIIAPIAAATDTALVRARRLWPWLLLLLLLIGVGLLAWWLWLNKNGFNENLTDTTKDDQSRIENYACNDRQGRIVPDFVTVFDTSGSMTLNIDASAADEQWLLDTGALYDHDNREPRRLNALSSPTREEITKQAYIKMLSSLHPDIETRLITFDGCGSAIDHGLFASDQREQLSDRLLETQAGGATPLAESLRVAASQVDGVSKDAMIILYIDGEDGCGENVCALAEQLANAKPRLQINVVDVSGNGLSSCAAELTNGRIYSSQDAEQINTLFLQAAEEFTDSTCE